MWSALLITQTRFKKLHYSPPVTIDTNIDLPLLWLDNNFKRTVWPDKIGLHCKGHQALYALNV